MLPTLLCTGDHWIYFVADAPPGAALRPSVCVRRGSAEASVAIATGEVVAATGFRPRELRQIRGMIRDHRRLLLRCWEDYARRCGGQDAFDGEVVSAGSEDSRTPTGS